MLKLANWWQFLLSLHVFLVELIFLHIWFLWGFEICLLLFLSGLVISKLFLCFICESWFLCPYLTRDRGVLDIIEDRSACVLTQVAYPRTALVLSKMHLWPSLKLRNSFKSTSQKRFQRMNSGKQSQSNKQKLLDGDKESSSPEISSNGGFAVVCRDVTMVLSCCYCCFCCGGTINLLWYFSL